MATGLGLLAVASILPVLLGSSAAVTTQFDYVVVNDDFSHAVAELMIRVSHEGGTWLFMLMSIIILVVMGSVLEGAAALIIFGPLLAPVAAQLGIAPLHFGVVLVIAMGIGLFAPHAVHLV